eukprot:849110_1
MASFVLCIAWVASSQAIASKHLPNYHDSCIHRSNNHVTLFTASRLAISAITFTEDVRRNHFIDTVQQTQTFKTQKQFEMDVESELHVCSFKNAFEPHPSPEKDQNIQNTTMIFRHDRNSDHDATTTTMYNVDYTVFLPSHDANYSWIHIDLNGVKQQTMNTSLLSCHQASCAPLYEAYKGDSHERDVANVHALSSFHESCVHNHTKQEYNEGSAFNVICYAGKNSNRFSISRIALYDTNDSVSWQQTATYMDVDKISISFSDYTVFQSQNTADYRTIVFDNSTPTPLDHDNPTLFSSIPKYLCHPARSLLGSTASSNPITSRKFALCFSISSSLVLTEVIRKQEDKDASNATTITPLTFVHATRSHDTTRPSRLTSHYFVSNHLFRSDRANHWKSSDHVLQSGSLDPFTNIHTASIIVFILFNICCILSAIAFRLVSPKHAKGFMLLNICLLCTSCSALNIVAGMHHNCALSSHNTVKCWGRNSYGSLGLGDVDNRGDDVNEMG